VHLLLPPEAAWLKAIGSSGLSSSGVTRRLRHRGVSTSFDLLRQQAGFFSTTQSLKMRARPCVRALDRLGNARAPGTHGEFHAFPTLIGFN
jgi:hypothetical protein